MKTLLHAALTFTVGLFTLSYLTAQENKLWATMNLGGNKDKGVIYSVNPDGTNGAIAVSFNGLNGANPSGNLILGPDNKLYGTTTGGGAHDAGVIFSINSDGSGFAVRHHFNTNEGWGPRDLLLGMDGKLYGTTAIGGVNRTPSFPNGQGVMYCFNPVNDRLDKLIDFNGLNGQNPQGLMQANNGKLYGMTRSGGGANFNGVIYSYEPVSATYTKLHSFNKATGELPTNCKFIQATDGKLYAMTTWGGSNNMGVLFNYDIANSTYNVMHHLSAAEGAYPTGTLLQANNGKLYGVTSYGGVNGSGVLFSYNLMSSSYGKLYDFSLASGAAPISTLIQGSDNLLYGITQGGGQNGQGVIFTFDINSESYTVLRDCGEKIGGQPMSGLLELNDNHNTTAIEPILNLGHAAIYPNPATDVLTLQAVNFDPENIVVRDMSGRSIIERAFATQLDISGLPAGIYIVEMKNQNSYSRTRLVKN